MRIFHKMFARPLLAVTFAGLAILTASLAMSTIAFAQTTAEPGREKILLDAGWRFAFGNATDPARDFGHATGFFSYLAKTGFGDGPANPAFDDRGWRLLDLPHDWAVEAPFDPKASHSHGYKAVGPGFPERSVGWYRRSFSVPAADLGRRIGIDFDGIFRNARVFVNGFFVGEQPSGYLGASYDITDYLNYGGDNVVAVRVDASMEEGWFYEGAGIYRHVWLVKTATLHVARYGTWVRTEIDGGAATVIVETTLTNDGREPADYVIEQAVVGPDGKLSAQKEAPPATLAAGRFETRIDSLLVPSPRLWSVETPVLYTLVTTIRKSGKAVDAYETAFGIRTIRFDPDAGFFLNGRHVVLKGTNNHQDHAGVGVAVPDALQEHRVNRLKAMGSNSYRASHNPPTPELLDACDRLGMLVIDENRLMGVNEYHRAELEQMIRRDRNHPSVILWSLGNEEWAIEGNIRGARIAATMQEFARRLDPTRLTTAAISGGWGGISTTIDVAGANYIKNANIDSQHARYPRQVIVGTEETTTNGTRGIYFDDRARGHLAPMEDGVTGGNVESGWRYYAARPWSAGVFYWTGFDYRGEPTPFGYPAIGSQFGILDFCGFPKDSFYYLKSWWSDETVLHVFPHWNWPGREAQDIAVRVYSNCEEVELLLNGASLGRKKMEPNGHLEWPVKYRPGALLARGYRGGREIITKRVETTGPPASIALAPDRADLRADGRDVAVVTVEVRDSSARIVPTAGRQVMFSIRGPGRIIGVGNGDPSSHEPDRFVESIRIIPIGEWRAPDPAIATGPIVFEAKFDRPQISGGEPVTLLLNAIGERQSVFLNGEPLYRDEEPAKARAEIALDVEKLRLSDNVLRIEASRFGNWSRREDLRQIHPASMRTTSAAKPWTRSTFNGLAQVIVQSSGQPGTITLEATSEGLSPKAITLVSRSVTQRR